MDSHHTNTSNPRFVLKININCCNACPKKLQKWMENIDGVDSVAIEAEKRLVYVTGKIEPNNLIKMIKPKFSKIAELYQEESNKNAHDSDSSNDCDSYSNCCSRPPPSPPGSTHTAEPVSCMVDDEICQDKFCTIQPRNSSVGNGVPFPQQPPVLRTRPIILPSDPSPPPPPPPPPGYSYLSPLSSLKYVTDYFNKVCSRDRGCNIM